MNPIVGDIAGNLAKLREARARAAAQGVALLITSELYLCAYPPEDLVVKPSFLNDIEAAVKKLAEETADGRCAILLGCPWREDERLYNAVLLLDGGAIAAKRFKHDLPNYGVFDEKRVFSAAPLPEPIPFRGARLGVMICEDMWTPAAAAHLKEQGADILIVPNGSPFETDKLNERQHLADARVRETGLPLVYLNQFGGQDELVFDGASFVMNAKGGLVASLPAWEEHVAVIEFPIKTSGIPSHTAAQTGKEDIGFYRAADIYRALMTGLRDYVTKNNFPGVILGMSGGIDSALAATIAVDALGADKVWGVMLPSPYTSAQSTQDAESSARALGCKLDTIGISQAMKIFDAALSPVLGDRLQGITQENIQSRCRGLILMALSNASGYMVLSTGNKSEMSAGYATLYGDMCGGFAVLKDVYKTEVYQIACWRNAHKPDTALGPAGEVIPQAVLTKAPTAELRPNQKDQDSLPPYDILDGILECLIERDMGVRDIAAQGYDPTTVERVRSLLDRAEYKRRQAPPGVKITRRNLGRDRRYPITNKYSDKR